MIAAFAVIMMFFFHFFAYPDLQPYINCYLSLGNHLDTPIEQIIAPFGQLCVALFAFNSGFIIAKQSSKYTSFGGNLKRGVLFLAGYWIVCIFFLIIGLIWDQNLPTLDIFLHNLIGLKLSARVDYVNVAHAWYVTYYIILLAIAPILIFLFRRTPLTVDILLYLVLLAVIPLFPMAIKCVFWPITATMSGFLTYKYGLFVRLRRIIGRINSKLLICVIGFTICGIVYLMRMNVLREYNAWWRLDGIYSLFFILGILLMINGIRGKIKLFLIEIGTLSMFLWFSHSIFANGPYALKSILYAPYLPVLIVMWGIVLCWLPSKAFQYIHRVITRFLR